MVLHRSDDGGPERLIEKARGMYAPISTICLFSGGSDSSVVAHRCRDQYDKLAFIDTGTAMARDRRAFFAQMQEHPVRWEGTKRSGTDEPEASE